MNVRSRAPWIALLTLSALVGGEVSPAGAQDGGGRGARTSDGGPVAALSVVLGCPTDTSIVVSVRSAEAVEAYVEVGTEPGKFTAKTAAGAIPAGTAVEVPLTGLKADTEYVYRLRTKARGAAEFAVGEEQRFRTQRKPGSAFTFALQGDSHPERLGKMFDPDLYVRTLRNVAADDPDFYVTLGDDFSIERLIERGPLTQQSVDQVYALQRGFLGIVGCTAPLFLVNGNHEQAARYLLDGTPDNAAVYAGRARISHFPLPEPGRFYTGDAEPVPHVGLLRDYYAFTWGDALFVTIDPYWHSAAPVDNEAGVQGTNDGAGGTDKGPKGEKGGRKNKGGRNRDLWAVGLGDAQYAWLRTTLETSSAKFKFVFAHHVLGTGRGGVEQARLYEWGGLDRNGTSRFAEKRPGWALPIHDLFVKTGVTIFFQGHDHIYAHQELDGVVYQSTPNPGDATYTAFNREAYTSGDVLPNSGHLRVTVRPEDVRVDYVRSVLPGEEKRAGTQNAAVGFSYTVKPRAGATK
ncbi:MAG: metallophosphoesterase [Planctomycetes bacterium]|nr:metallophosphoesterase [Planctomycetota bacterium]